MLIDKKRIRQSFIMRREETSNGKVAQCKTSELLFRIYTIAGFWKIKSQTKWKRYLYGIYFYVMKVWIVSWFILNAINAYYKRHQMHLLINNLCCTIMTFLMVIKSLTCMLRMDDIDNIRRNLARSWCLPDIGQSKEDRKIITKADREILIVFLVMFIGGFTSYFFWVLIPVLDYSSHEQMLPLPYPEIFTAGETPGYECLYAYHVISLLISLFIVTSYDLIYSGFAQSNLCSV